MSAASQKLWDDIDALCRGFSAITREEFLAESNATRSTADYFERAWGDFRYSPLNYCRSRSPNLRGKALCELAMRKAGLAS